jgi:hypothetical protein
MRIQHDHKGRTIMEKITRYIRIATLTGVSMFISLVMAGACLAGSIVAVHGHSGDIQYMDRVASTDLQKLGWGLDFIQNSGVANWIHYSIPTIPFTKTRYLLVYYQTGITGETADSSINKFHVWDGPTKIYENNSVSLTGGPAYAIIDMGEDKTISWGLGLSIEVGAGVEMMSHRMQIFAVWAEWH